MLSLCITNFNRTDLLFESFIEVLHDDRITEIIIVDDHSEPGIWSEIQLQLELEDKVKLFRNAENIGCYHNKREAISKASNEWAIILDSDNVLDKVYIDRVENLWIAGLNEKTFYQPELASPHFDFSKYAGMLIDKSNVHKFADDSTFCTMLNACNYFVNKNEYLRTWEDREEPWTADSILQAYNWLNAGNSIYIVPGLQYSHRIHDGSHYRQHYRKTGDLYSNVVSKLKQLR